MYFINSHEIVLDKNELLEPWTPLDRVIWLAMNFIKHCPVDSRSGLPWYLAYSCFWTDPLRPAIWPDNPAGKFAWAVTTLKNYYPYSGDHEHIEIVRTMLDQLIQYRVPAHQEWGNAPYASAHPGTGIYFGARADGEYVTEPDKVAQVGRAFVDFYEMVGDEKYLQAGVDCANVLVKHLQAGNATHSPVPFRVDVIGNRTIEAYTADMIPLVRLLDELIRLGMKEYQSPRDQVFSWIIKFPLQNNQWKGYFEDIRLDAENNNRDQLSPLETARYFMENPENAIDLSNHVPTLIHWVSQNLGAQPFFGAIPVHEQKFCHFVMGSHTARFASLCARWFEVSGDGEYREMAIRALNWASYMANEDGTVTVGVDRPDYYNQCWFTDGYFDYVPHFITTMASIPALAPGDSDHMLRSSTIIRKIRYSPYDIAYDSFDFKGTQILKLTFTPSLVLSGGEALPPKDAVNGDPGWYFDQVSHVLTVHQNHSHIQIQGQESMPSKELSD
jgi:hypothetical protein